MASPSFSVVADADLTTSKTRKFLVLPVDPNIEGGIAPIHSPKLQGMLFYGKKDNAIYYSDGIQFYLLVTQASLEELEIRVALLEAIVISLQNQITLTNANVTALQNQLTLTNNVIATIGDNTGLNVDFVWRGLPPVGLYQYTWNGLENQIRNMLAGIGSESPSEQSVWAAPFYDGTPAPIAINPPGDYSGWLNTSAFGGTYFNPKFDQLYQAHTSSSAVMVSEILPKTMLLKVEVGTLGGNITNLLSNFTTNIITPKSIAGLALGYSAFNILHPETAARTQLAFSTANLIMNDPPNASTFTDNPYIQASPTGQILDTVFGFVFKLASFIPVVGSFAGPAYSVIQGGLDLAQAVTTVGVNTPNPSLPFTSVDPTGNAVTFPNKSWVANDTYVTYTVTESMNYVNGGSLTPANPPPVPRTPSNWHTTTTRTFPNQTGPWVNGVVSLGAGYQCRLRMDQVIMPGVALFPITHLYQDAPIAPEMGQPGLLTDIEVKAGTSSTLPLVGGGFNVHGDWENIAYNINDVVTVGGIAYACIQTIPGPNAPQPSPPNASFWQPGTGGFNQGVWNAATVYLIADYVTFDGAFYTCIALYNPPIPQPSPPNLTYWVVLPVSGATVPSTYKYAQYQVNLSINRPNVYDIEGNQIPAGWNAIYINDRLFAVFNGIAWLHSDTFVNP